ncbi:MAG: hypothetical protein HY298_17380 [Verrucomicrobia bacterium]|nr:hypothetical protein [Verrucomicrobiota bacterium]
MGATVGGLGAFASSLQKDGLDSALDTLALSELHGKEAPEVIAKIAEHLCEAGDGIDQEILNNSLRTTILEAANLGSELGYEDLEAGLQAFLGAEGIEGLIELLLGRFAFEFVWSRDEQHVQAHSTGEADVEALQDALLHSCKGEVRDIINDAKAAGSFDRVDWFGNDGVKLGHEIATKVEARLIAHAED